MTLAHTLASHAIKATPDLSSGAQKSRPENRVMDVIGCIIAGSQSEAAVQAAARIVENSNSGNSTAAFHQRKIKPAAAAQANALLARAYDFGPLTPFDGQEPIWSHISETTVPVALALAEDSGCTAQQMLEALVVADDLAARISRSLKFLPGTGWDSPGLINRFASAVIAARLWKMSPAQLICAWGLVLQQVSGTFQSIDEHSEAFTFIQGLTARDGIEAADLARHGYTGGPGALSGRFGLFHTFGVGEPDMAAVVAGLGEIYYGDEIFKPYPGCRFTHGPIDLARVVHTSVAADPKQVASIKVTVHPHHIGSPLDLPMNGAAISRPAALFSFQFQSANALLRGKPIPVHFDELQRNDPQVLALAGLVQLEPSADSTFPLTGAQMKLELHDGSVQVCETDFPWGDPRGISLSSADIDAKFQVNLRHAGMSTAGDTMTEELRAQLASNDRLELKQFFSSGAIAAPDAHGAEHNVPARG